MNITKINHSGKSTHDEKVKLDTNLYLVIKPTNTKSFMYRYYFKGKAQSMGLGGYPTITLKKAREEALKLNIAKEQGINPKDFRKNRTIDQDKLFENIANDWFSRKKLELRKVTLSGYEKALQSDIIPYFKDKSIDVIKLREIAIFLQRHCNNSNSKQMKYKTILSGIYNYATLLNLCEHNLMLNDFKHILAPKTNGHFKFINPILDSDNLSLLLNKIHGLDNVTTAIKTALQIAPLLAFRPKLLTILRWSYYKSKEAILVIPAKKMKANQDFIQPLSRQAIQLIESMKPYKKSDYIFTNKKGKPIDPNRLRNLIQKDLGFDGKTLPRQTMHGFRHIVSTLLYSLQREYKWQTEALELILDHRKRNQIQAIYNTYQYIEERREILQTLADYFDNLKLNN
ncbi:hypothetical protein BZ13_1590 [Francisella philomiragia subsp. philomiragia ATCC 25015]|uniref:tyrosine-type recombinase/integrase n=1 Tax=Francisella philomiragia TaxID=28110 RepID=UPI0001AF793B|nr:site-specific integrase [Francisella philomiragia]AJI75832.1 hypothetical protein BZ13_1590 [Francisella philomiragia subsp. philomiragia ATCC 25015]EET20226.1 phage integrase [Francisella philomiragia subsp. philomiragia ATCC 25015]MBK2237270.1 integrase arm-type DNA-binding domain-containing protein [Francisella philomiragia]